LQATIYRSSAHPQEPWLSFFGIPFGAQAFLSLWVLPFFQYSNGELAVVPGSGDKFIKGLYPTDFTGIQAPLLKRFDPPAFTALSYPILPLRTRSPLQGNILFESTLFCIVRLILSRFGV